MIAPTIAPISSIRPATSGGAWTITYFRSGWAFLIPYLAAYLLYAWLRWPVNVAVAGSSEHGAKSWIPCLLHIYWALHAIHVALGGFALRAWWRNRSTACLAVASAKAGPLAAVYRLFPWVFLGLLFHLPGVYLEFPADPWHHFTKINEWSWVQTVTTHSTWNKSSYFIAYSFIGKITPPALQLKWFDVYYTGCCLLLCWQYFRLARAIGLGGRTSLVFVVLQALLFGNSLFGFYRYYGMSSSLFAQLGAVALTRIVLEAARPQEEQGTQLLQRALLLLAPCSSLLALTAFNHVQGLGIAGFGIAAVIVWRLIEWRRSMIGWLALAALLAGIATIAWFPRPPLLDQEYRPQGWLTAWYGFNLFQPSSPAFDRAAAILGLAGLANLAAGLFLLRRNHVVAWLTLMPVIALCLPFIAIPFAGKLAMIADLNGDYILVFHRMLLATPAGMALVVLAPYGAHGSTRRVPVFFALLLSGLVALMTVPAHGPYFNRLYHFLMQPPDDLAMRHVIHSPESVPLDTIMLPNEPGEPLSQMLIARYGILTTPGIGYVLNSTGSTLIANTRLWMTWPKVDSPSANASMALKTLQSLGREYVHEAPHWPVPALFSSGSTPGHLSGHWLANEVALDHSAQAELFDHSPGAATPPQLPQIWVEWLQPRHKGHYWGKGAGLPVSAVPLEDRGPLRSETVIARIQVGEPLILRPVMRTPSGNGWRVSIAVNGPHHASRSDFTSPPSPLDPDNWVLGDHHVQFKQPGEYILDITGTVLWPGSTFTVRYHLTVQANDTEPPPQQIAQ